jgi:hypothetical protein
VHKQILGEGSKVLTTEDKHPKFIVEMQTLTKEAQTVDTHFTIMPIHEKEKSKILTDPNNVPLNHTKLFVHISFPSNMSFEKHRPWERNNGDLGKDDYVDPYVNFSFVSHTTKNLRRSWLKLGRSGGTVRQPPATDVTQNP